jgi:hypothetical protein
MVFLNINSKNYKEKNNKGKSPIDSLNHIIKNGPDTKVFILYYMEGCGPCNATRPEWSKLKHALKQLDKDSTIAIVDIDQALSGDIKDMSEPSSFPTMRYISNNGKTIENYEDSDIEIKDRTIDSFVDWVNSKTNSKKGGGSKRRHMSKRKSIRKRGRGRTCNRRTRIHKRK